MRSFSVSFVAAALMVLSTVEAIPQGPAHGLLARAPCSPGYYPNVNGGCNLCDPGHYCPDGQSYSQCGTGQYNPNNGTTTVCPNCPAGYYQDEQGQASCKPAPRGAYVLYPGARDYRLVSGGAFQSLPGQSKTCLTCCGWAAVGNGNTKATRCSGDKPFAYPGSGDGCTDQPIDCEIPSTCSEAADGTCPAGNSDH
ncbi:hypothetical protein FB45DRAFT_1027061 [Roridomyces roridus]|uniref:Tyrosine-protein kinase ephrin type A/B receptor-like domain-containing protein n=1 Tax=Roridomyces roridus TaxID=1738132 RepID=A0AAD7BX26_9AGAR|nr:hypothetical protein FB45DRAFT_1027061 [Roridomyces roridus]